MFTGVSSADIGHLLPAKGSKGKSKRYVQDFCLKTAAGIFSSQPLFLTAGSDSEYYFRFLVVLLFNILIVVFFNRRHPPSSPPSKRAKGICPRNTIDRFLRGHPAQEVHPHLKRPWVIFDIMSEGKKRPSHFFDIGKVSVWPKTVLLKVILHLLHWKSVINILWSHEDPKYVHYNVCWKPCKMKEISYLIIIIPANELNTLEKCFNLIYDQWCHWYLMSFFFFHCKIFYDYWLVKQ